MDKLTANRAFALALIHFVAAFQLRRVHLFAILLLSSFMEKTRA
ncbi:murein transglycosylase [Vibrio harveyi]|jgi:membrane-bound lytic murein transglycosylase A|uniref:Murein transglycosylase n=1 Tax=Vibrio harveyi TaxID=669 RepID=A0A2S0SAE5_VIBHA|nr:murein transglycosylase [Vibrio harveyi]EMR35354.1 murein transglycosylase A [Vibrio harveyi CAIM 1792]PQJ39535.1 murein transglycosylase [Vibrio campbellii]AUW38255.1 murein transglycosylase [Vibrio harveyi]AWA99624.1 murein transglycosylase [Vibrio harveyi]